MQAWTCPECKRQFGRRNQSHDCAPGMSKEQYFSTGPDLERQVYEAVAAHLETLGPVHTEYVSVGIFFKRVRTFAELRPMRNRVRLSLLLSRRFKHPRFVRTYHGPTLRSAYFVDLHDVNHVDAEVREWLTEAYFSSPA
jgi:hypothetical protein